MGDETDETPNPFHAIKDGLVFELDAMPEGGYFITVSALPGCTSFGESIDHALVMVQEAISGSKARVRTAFRSQHATIAVAPSRRSWLHDYPHFAQNESSAG